jgi:hypothetical protein
MVFVIVTQSTIHPLSLRQHPRPKQHHHRLGIRYAIHSQSRQYGSLPSYCMGTYFFLLSLALTVHSYTGTGASLWTYEFQSRDLEYFLYAVTTMDTVIRRTSAGCLPDEG